MKSFIMMGQSNMAGRGEFDDVPEIENPLCSMFRMGRWQKMSEPINPDRAIFGTIWHSGRSLAASFADCYAKKYKEQIGLIPCADGGTSINQWLPGKPNFNYAMAMAELAKASSDICGILWHQGETDCARGELSDYFDKLALVINTARKNISDDTLPVIMGELSENENTENRETHILFNKRLHDFADGMSNITVVSSAELTMKPDRHHFDSKSLRIFGERYFEAYEKLTEVKE